MPQAVAGAMVTPNIRLVRPLGEGGMGAVWIADHLALRTQVVVKFIASELADSSEAQERFSREAAAAAQVKSPHVVQTFDHGITEDGTPYIVMELLEGRDLGEALAEGRLPPESAVEVIAQLSRALDRAHERGIIHRDIKPGNIFLCEQGGGEIFVKLLDFGIAKGVELALSKGVDSNTKTGSMIGSPFYMSPEQILGSKDLDHRSDLWSVGVVAFEALTGSKPFDAETMGGLAIRIHSEPLPLPSSIESSLDPAVDAWFLRACSRNPSERFSTAKEMAEALARALGGEMPRSLDPPRMSTGPRRTAREPQLAAGASTDAGVVRSTAPSSTRGRVLALVAILVIGAPLSFFAIRALVQKGDVRSDLRVEPSTTSSATSAASDKSLAVQPPPSAPIGTGSASAPLVATNPQPPVPTTHSTPTAAPPKIGASKNRPKDPNPPASTSLPSQPPPPATTTTARPATSGHDIF